MVTLATEVQPKDALTAQLAMNHTTHHCVANLAVSLVDSLSIGADMRSSTYAGAVSDTGGESSVGRE
jgi:hypothetical protein